MQREYKRIQQHKEKLLKMKKQGLKHREIAEKLGYKKSQIKEFFCSNNEKQRKIQSGIPSNKKGRPCKKEHEISPSVQKLDKLTQMRYVMASKDRYIKQLEMENELMRDFLSLTERK